MKKLYYYKILFRILLYFLIFIVHILFLEIISKNFSLLNRLYKFSTFMSVFIIVNISFLIFWILLPISLLFISFFNEIVDRIYVKQISKITDIHKAIDLVSKDISAFKYLNDKLRNNKEVILSVVKQDGWSLKFSGTEIKNMLNKLYRDSI